MYDDDDIVEYIGVIYDVVEGFQQKAVDEICYQSSDESRVICTAPMLDQAEFNNGDINN